MPGPSGRPKAASGPVGFGEVLGSAPRGEKAFQIALARDRTARMPTLDVRPVPTGVAATEVGMGRERSDRAHGFCDRDHQGVGIGGQSGSGYAPGRWVGRAPAVQAETGGDGHWWYRSGSRASVSGLWTDRERPGAVARRSLDCSARLLSGQLSAVLPTMRSSTSVQSTNLPPASTVWIILSP